MMINLTHYDTNKYNNYIPKFSIPGTIIFIIYITPLSTIFSHYSCIKYYLYADDLQLYIYLHADSDPITINL